MKQGKRGGIKAAEQLSTAVRELGCAMSPSVISPIGRRCLAFIVLSRVSSFSPGPLFLPFYLLPSRPAAEATLRLPQAALAGRLVDDEIVPFVKVVDDFCLGLSEHGEGLVSVVDVAPSKVNGKISGSSPLNPSFHIFGLERSTDSCRGASRACTFL